MHDLPTRGRAWAAAATAVTLLASCGVLTSACQARREGPREAEGLLVSARAAPMAALLARLETMTGTPLARLAHELAAALPDCDVLEAQSPEARLDELRTHLRCADPEGPLAAVHERRGKSDVAFVWPLEGAAAPIAGTLALDARGDVSISLEIPPPVGRGPRSLLVPSAIAPGPGVLSRARALAWARVRADEGLDLSGFVPEDSQGAQLFRLKSELFAGAVLDDTWEAAIYLPGTESAFPRVALAVGFQHRRAAVAAMEAFLEELQRAWPVRRSELAFGSHTGACLLDLRILPELAPCYVATDDAIAVGWNPQSLRAALAGAGADEPLAGEDARSDPLAGASGLVVELGRFALADARLAEAAGLASRTLPVATGGSIAASVPALPWSRLVAAGRRDAGRIRVRVRLESPADSGALRGGTRS